ncbi:MAG: hypothetical protein HDR04_00575 [Lachnospiraceae bacterium]|nr:hypothetical protein [Lachnospiraceae bacterium]
MLRILSLFSLLFWLAVIPFCIGLIPANFISAKKRGPGFVLLAGYFGMWALFEVVAIPAVLFVKYDNFKVASVLFAVLSILCAAAGLWLWYRNRRAHKTSYKNDTNVNFVDRIKEWIAAQVKRMSWAERIEWLLFFVLLGFQLYKAVAYASFDGDDAYYVVESLIAQQADVMYRILPYTGRPTDLDVRHALAVFPMWIAFVATRSHIHATIVSHTIMPLVLIPLSYLVYYEIGRRLFKTNAYGMKKEGTASKKTGRNRADDGNIFDRENLPVFMLLMTLFQIFGNVSIYTNETFFLTRTWQGKAVAGCLVIPALFWMFLWIYDGKRHGDAGMWFVFVCINMAAGVCSSIAVFLVCILMALTAFCLAITERDYRVILKMGAVCIPNVIYMAVYVIVAYSGLF